MAYQVAIVVLFLLLSAWLRRNEAKSGLFPVAFAFFIAALVFALSSPFGGGTTMENRTFNILVSMMLVVIPLLVLVRLSGDNWASIYLKKGNLRLGLIIGLVVFFFFLVTAVPFSIWIFGGASVTSDQLLALAPWIAAFVSANSLKEELLYRGLFLKKFELFLGKDMSNLTHAVVFSLAHLYIPFDSFTIIYWALAFFLGLGFAAVMQKTDSLLGSLLFHAGSDIPLMLAIFSVL